MPSVSGAVSTPSPRSLTQGALWSSSRIINAYLPFWPVSWAERYERRATGCRGNQSATRFAVARIGSAATYRAGIGSES